MCRLLNLPETPPGRETRYLITRYEETDMALLVDTVIDLVDLSSETREPVPSTLPQQQSRLLQAIFRLDDRPVALLDLAEIVALSRGEG
jgi:chemotaxis signal transduction protein